MSLQHESKAGTIIQCVRCVCLHRLYVVSHLFFSYFAGRMFDFHVLDMFELGIEKFISLSQIKVMVWLGLPWTGGD